MSRRFIATIIAGAIAISGFTAQPVRAGNENLERFLLGAATLVILGAAIENGRKEVVVKRHHTPRATPARRAQPIDALKARTHTPRTHQHNAHRRALLPEYCLRTVRSHKGPRTIYGRGCLKNNYRAFGALPDQCRARIQGPQGTRHGFRPGCLYRAGFRG